MNSNIVSNKSNSQQNQNYTVSYAPWLAQILKLHSTSAQSIKSNNTLFQENTSVAKEKPKEFKVSPPILDDDYLSRKANHKQLSIPVQPLRDKDDIEKAKAYFYNTPTRYSNMHLRDYVMFIVGLNTARRGGDIGKLQIENFLNKDGTFKTHLVIEEGKTGKIATILIHPNVKEAMSEYLSLLGTYKMSDYLFSNYKTGTPLTTNAIWKRINKMQTALNLDVNLGTHSMRKTYAYQASINNPNDSATEIKISDFLNHSDVKTTHIYTQSSQDEMDKFVLKNGL